MILIPGYLFVLGFVHNQTYTMFIDSSNHSFKQSILFMLTEMMSGSNEHHGQDTYMANTSSEKEVLQGKILS